MYNNVSEMEICNSFGVLRINCDNEQKQNLSFYQGICLGIYMPKLNNKLLFLIRRQLNGKMCNYTTISCDNFRTEMYICVKFAVVNMGVNSKTNL